MAFIRRNALDLLLWALFAASALLMLKSSSDPRPDFIKGTPIEALLKPFPTGNQVTFDITVGIIVSLFVYLLVVRLPEWQKKGRLKAHLLRRYDDLKEQCLMHFLWACSQPAESTLIDSLKNQKEFRDFFNASVAPDQDRWHQVLNGLTDEYVRSIVRELDSFRGEVDFVLTSVDVSDEEAFRLLRNLTEVLQRSRHWSDREDQLKPLSQFMWSIFAGWSIISGYTDRDVIHDMITAI
ncbi:hypothetical protein [Methyloversatilis sp. XJ19-49]|uniref:hypothetical protein n=1 Tax=Methyloversatilis sp. XJ19-49 TaxID=2963429 RepID=UPI00211BF7CC|nr:hypothetical protein [Methyloversatilis sp. XJ19-49]MCQ9378324.1 hypothetical protein [Methyloversatilis sp. XJ19-49]